MFIMEGECRINKKSQLPDLGKAAAYANPAKYKIPTKQIEEEILAQKGLKTRETQTYQLGIRSLG